MPCAVLRNLPGGCGVGVVIPAPHPCKRSPGRDG